MSSLISRAFGQPRRTSDRLQRAGMRRAAVLAVFTLAATLGVCATASAQTADAIKARGSMTVATEDDFKPFEFVDNGVPTGYDTEMLALVKKKLGIDIKQQIMPWSGILPGVTTGKYDAKLSAAVLVTPERKAVFDFTLTAHAVHHVLRGQRKNDLSPRPTIWSARWSAYRQAARCWPT